jgi:pimeloyl-ACP methyl ester carboxylesterase
LKYRHVAAAPACRPAPGRTPRILHISARGADPARMVTTVYLPAGPGPFPLWVFNHGKNFGNTAFQARSRPDALAEVLLRQGYAVAAPNRRGFADSGGRHLSHWANPLAGGLCCARDIETVVLAMCGKPYIDASRIVVSGHSYGALGTLAYGMKPHAGVRALVNFAGGLRGESDQGWQQPLREAFRYYGRRARVPSLWLYAENDSFWPLDYASSLHAAYCEHGASARFVNLGRFKECAHRYVLDPDGVDFWWPQVAELLLEIAA